MKIALRVVCVGSLAFAGSSAFAAVLPPVYSQPSNAPSQAPVASAGAPGQAVASRMADSFTLTRGCLIEGFRFWGGSQNLTSPGLGNIRGLDFRLYGDAGGRPDATNVLWHGSPFTNDVFHVATGRTMVGGGTEYEFLVWNAPAVYLNPGTYWFSVGGILINPNGDALVWSTSTTGDQRSASFLYPNGPWAGIEGADLAFEVIPAPGTLILAAVGLLGTRRRRR